MNILKKSSLWFSVSALFIITSCVLFFVTYQKTGSFFYYGIDFTGGTLMEIASVEEEKREEIKELFQATEKMSSFLVTGTGDIQVKLRDFSNEEHENILSSILEIAPNASENRFITIGPSVGKVMKEKAVMALLFAIIAIVLYIAYAFSEMNKELSAWKMGFSAILALVHDVVITMGVFSVLGIFWGIEIDTLFITALLTIMGFSVHDTIVVFDRFRENMKYARPTETLDEIGGRAITQTIPRSLNTSLSTLFPMLAFFFFGPQSIQYFVFTLICGIIVGTYSSIFLATPFFVWWSKKN
jgi:preprotein translocase subunit SecF